MMEDDLCTLYFDHGFHAAEQIVATLRQNQISCMLKQRSGLPYLKTFQYQTLSILNDPAYYHRIAKTFYDLNIPPGQTRTQNKEVMKEIVSYSNQQITSWFNRKVQERQITCLISEFFDSTTACQWWFDKGANRIPICEFLSTAARAGLILIECSVVRYIVGDDLREIEWAFYAEGYAWKSIEQEFFSRYGYTHVPTNLYPALELEYLNYEFNNTFTSTLCDIHSLCIDSTGDIQLLDLQTKNRNHTKDHYLTKIKNREMEMTVQDLNQQSVVGFIEVNKDEWNITNVAFNAQSKKYMYLSEVQTLEQQIFTTRNNLASMEDEFKQITPISQKRQKIDTTST